MIMSFAARPLLPLLLLCGLTACTERVAGEGEGEEGEGEGEEGEGEEGEGEGEEGEGEGEVTVPVVSDREPAVDAVDVDRNARVVVEFSEDMDAASLAGAVVLSDNAVAVAVAAVVTDDTIELYPRQDLAADTAYVVTVATTARSAAGVPLANIVTWTFSTGAFVGPGLPVDLGTAGDFAVLAKSAVSTVPPSVITGDVGVSPAAATFLTGFSLTADATNTFSTSTQVTGQLFAADMAVPTPQKMTTAVLDMQRALTSAAGRAPDVTELGAGDISGLTLDEGVYQWGTGLLVASDIVLDGSATDVWIFQIAQDLTVSNGVRVTLAGGALAENVFWQVSGLVDVGTTAHLEGNVLCQTSIDLGTGASINGRLLAQTAVSLDSATVVAPD